MKGISAAAFCNEMSIVDAMMGRTPPRPLFWMSASSPRCERMRKANEGREGDFLVSFVCAAWVGGCNTFWACLFRITARAWPIVQRVRVWKMSWWPWGIYFQKGRKWKPKTARNNQGPWVDESYNTSLEKHLGVCIFNNRGIPRHSGNLSEGAPR